ncbi:uncharacterized protein [Haliotis asinina]|uniref:uncharacterized protein n=1 Tax=Haliotis asinina TaxID=109174 RepID=UPI003531C0F2
MDVLYCLTGLLLVLLEDVKAEYCYSSGYSSSYSSVTYCSSGCCGTYSDQYCCTRYAGTGKLQRLCGPGAPSPAYNSYPPPGQGAYPPPPPTITDNSQSNPKIRCFGDLILPLT